MSDTVDNAMELHRAGRLAEAEAVYRRLIERSPYEPRVLLLLAQLLMQRGAAGEAVPLLRTAVAGAPKSVRVLVLLANALRSVGQLGEARDVASRAIAIDAGAAAAHNELGLALIRLRNTESAIDAFRRAAQLEANYAEAWSNLGAALAEKRQVGEAVEALRKAVQADPRHVGALNNLASALAELGQTDEAIAHWRTAAALRPDAFDVLLNLARTLLRRGEFAEADALANRAVALRPNESNARYIRGVLSLLKGDLANGFADYEHRFEGPRLNVGGRRFDRPRWTGGDVRGRTILLHAEQGLGDMIMFARYAPLLADRGAAVIIESPRELSALLGMLRGVKKIITRGEKLPPFDFRAAVGSLPALFGTTLATIPAQIPYLAPPPQRLAKWTDILAHHPPGRRVGLVWSGNPAHSNDRNRSIPLRELSEILTTPDVAFFSLQKGAAATQLFENPLPAKVHDHTDAIHDFADTAALVAHLDLVIAVDTAVAHLAGAMGKPVWILVPFVPDWRWMLHRSDSPWYPIAKIFRQPALDEWSPAIARIADELRAMSVVQ